MPLTFDTHEHYTSALEAVLFAAERPISTEEIA